MKQRKEMPNDKRVLLDMEGYEVYNRELIRRVFPRIIAEVKAIKARSGAGDIIPFYFAILSYVDGNEYRKDGALNMRYGYGFPSQGRIQEMTGIDRKRHKLLTDILRINGIFSDVRDFYEGTKRYKWYKPSFCPRISEDGYLVDENGECIVPDYSSLKFP
ncbi:hypothetical protein J0K78_17050 [Halobacillus sp. GSS1]|uniref:hypothetical protein n=1 Tax=Halobacillus sp. GSS1 TaxID=2815919 RepID=UPI001A8FC4ED|nr:hypothetical protein [Halobacillus sp. GSS1]MBN9655986.1 hypothetical protein [Halobacillus sp. GSS1]